MPDAMYRFVVESSTDPMFVAALDGTCVYANGAARTLLHLEAGAPTCGALPGARALLHELGDDEERVGCCGVPAGRWIELRVRAIVYDGRRHVLAIGRDVTVTRRAERRHVLQLAASRVLAEATSVEHAAKPLLDAVCTGIGCEVGELWILDHASNELRCIEQWCSGELVGIEELVAVTRAMRFPAGTALPGTVWQRNEPVWMPDVQSNPRFARREAVARAGLRSAVGCPILHHGQLCAVLVVLGRDVIERDPEMHELLVSVGHQIGQFIERLRVERALRESDVRLREVVEEHYRRSLREKEVLIQEIHHRVKNNLQLVISLLALQADQLEPQYPGIRQAFVDNQLRIQTMVQIHDTLCRGGDVESVELAPHIESICEQIYRTFEIDPGRVELVLAVADMKMGLDVALPCGLIISELVANALKHAFPEGRRGRISVHLGAAAGEFDLEVRDDGIGLPPALDPRLTETFGLQLIRDLTEQLRARLVVNREAGTAFSIRVPREAPA